MLKPSEEEIIFLPKNTTSKTQPLDSGIIANWKIHYKKRMLRFICSKVSATITASDIVKSIDVLMSIEWGKQAWDEVQESTIIKCFKSTGLYPDTELVDDDPFEGEDLVQHEQIDTMLATLGAPCTAQDPTRANWPDQAREILFEGETNSDDNEPDVSRDKGDDPDISRSYIAW
ncbi:tigger transposable element-derived protein 1-like [Nematostella vectensis]|uniref:tigger transposable element-derived protein 1-like n=1 Tax=Nematostella vectensis TaxID=45351 RepID=UPI00139061C2|nr:tigger transposable element-derived protein 1-like [Nematostella vectensis]